jgi:PAS domain S-box-containing protein
MARPTILAVDDSRVNLLLYRKLFARHLPEWNLVTAMSAEEAVALARQAPPDCALIDVCMPGMNGIELCRTLKATPETAQFPILLITGEDLNVGLRVTGLDAGADDFLQRTCADVDLLAKLRVMMRIKRAEDELRLANRRLAGIAGDQAHELHSVRECYQHLFDVSGDAVAVFRLEADAMPGPFLAVNPAFCRLSGYSRDQLLQMRLDEITTPDRAEYTRARMQSFLQYKQVYYESEVLTSQRQIIPVGVSAKLLDTTAPFSAILVAHSLEQAAAPVRNLLDVPYPELASQTGQVLYHLDLDHAVARWSGATMQVLGYEKRHLDTLTIRDWQHAVHPDDRRRVLRMYQRAIQSVGRYQLEYRLKNASGEYRHVEDLGVVLADEAGQASRLLGTLKDITARVRAEEERRQLEQGVQHAQRLESLGVLAGGIAHDFNNILSAIIGLTDISLQQLSKDSEVYADLNESLKAAHRAKDLVRQILAFSRQTGVERSPICLHLVAREVLKLLRASLTPMIDIVDSIDVHSGAVMANPAQMHQVIMNFCTNAAHAMSSRGGTLEVRVVDVDVDEAIARAHSRLHKGPYVKLSVRDSGHGMNDTVMKRIFDPFFTTKGPGEGTGMGLSVVDGIVASHGGVVTVESRPGIGSTFHTWFPRVEAPQLEEERVRQRMPSGKERILFVDDEDIVLRFGESTLNRLGYRIALYRDPVEALEAFRESPASFDLIITDQMMPKMTGYELARAVRAVRADIPIILFTGFSADVTDKEFQEAGINEIVMKPVIAMELATTIRGILDKVQGSAV